MPAYNFMPRFAAAVESGRKRQTIRMRRERPTKPGDTLSLFVHQRMPRCRVLGKHVCKSVTPIHILPYVGEVFLGDGTTREWLSQEAVESMARADGFASVEAFFEFFRRYTAMERESLEIIEW